MRSPTILAIVFFIVIAVLLYPLLLFAIEVPQNPSLLGLQVKGEALNETHVLLRIEISYSGSIPMTDVKMKLAERIFDIGDLRAGDVKSITAIVRIEEFNEMQRAPFAFKFKIAGLYSVEVKGVD
ncbi:MAG: hypothetical protein QE164_00470 [Candidatus Nezhaarchaeota archaeon]|nr:hypothetical protein [Candidatus Nezhaarchaeota archaeon]